MMISTKERTRGSAVIGAVVVAVEVVQVAGVRVGVQWSGHRGAIWRAIRGP